eukprot:129195_1
MSNQYNVYWYNYPYAAFGFAPSSTINLVRRSTVGYEWYDDTDINSDDNRLTWSFNQDGYRAGTILLNNNADWQKLIYYKQCEAIVTPSPNINPANCYTTNTITKYQY